MSLCRYCGDPVIWLARPTGGWFPPFNDDGTLTDVMYQATWSKGDWRVEPLDKEVTARLAAHRCNEYEATKPTLGDPIFTEEEKELISQHVQYHEKQIKIREVRVQPTRDQYITKAFKLAAACEICGAAPFSWCTYKVSGEETQQLHSMRGIEP